MSLHDSSNEWSDKVQAKFKDVRANGRKIRYDNDDETKPGSKYLKMLRSI